MNATEKLELIQRYLKELEERIEIRYEGSHEDKRVGYGYEVVKANIEQVLAGTYMFADEY